LYISSRYMCCFNKPIDHVGATRILVTPTRNGRQVTVYENVVGQAKKRPSGAQGMYRDADGKVKVGQPPPELVAQREAEAKAKAADEAKNAMILPAPLNPGQKIEVLDLSKDNFDFKRIHSWFPQEQATRKDNQDRLEARSMQKLSKAPLEVHQVGNYFISLADNLNDLDRIDPNVFRVSPLIKEVFSAHYATGYGFVICSFNPNTAMQAHPIAYVHDQLPNGKLFVPTRHQHTEDVKPTEKFDHEIYSINTTSDGGSGKSVEEIERHNDQMAGREFKAAKSQPAAIELAINSDILNPLYPKIVSFRRAVIKGNHPNNDLIFVGA